MKFLNFFHRQDDGGSPYQDRPGEEKLDALREQMVEHQIKNRGVEDERVLDAMRNVPRHEFTPELPLAAAYEDRPLPIGEDQTIGTDSSEKAADHAVDLARKLDAEVHTIFVASAPRAGFTPSEPDLDPLKQSGEEYVARVRENVETHEIPCTTNVFESDRPYEGILTYAEENDIDFIVMGTHGEDAPFPRFFLGSVTERVLKASPIPVIVIPAHDEDKGEES